MWQEESSKNALEQSDLSFLCLTVCHLALTSAQQLCSRSFISKHNAKHRMQCCTALSYWTLEQWKCVLWSDKSHVFIWHLLWWMPGERYLSDCTVPSIKFDGRWTSKVHEDMTRPHRLLSSSPLNTFSRTDITSRTSRPTPLSDLINFLLVEWGEIPTDTLQNLAESLSKRVECVRAAKWDKLLTDAYGFRMRCHKSPVGVMCKWPITFIHIVYL